MLMERTVEIATIAKTKINNDTIRQYAKES